MTQQRKTSRRVFATGSRNKQTMSFHHMDLVEEPTPDLHRGGLPTAHSCIAIDLEHHPIDERNAAAAVYPMFRIVVDQANEPVREMVSGRSVFGESRSSLSGPVAWTSPDKPRAALVRVSAGFRPAVQEIAELDIMDGPYIDRYCTVDGLAAAAATQGTYPYRVRRPTKRNSASSRQSSSSVNAKTPGTCWSRNGKPAQRRHFQPVFEYFDALELLEALAKCHGRARQRRRRHTDCNAERDAKDAP